MSGSLNIYTVDSFTNVPFAGNPAAVCLDITEQVGSSSSRYINTALVGAYHVSKSSK